VIELIGAAKALEENSAFVSRSAREKFRRAIQNFESSWVNFSTGRDGHMINIDGLLLFMNAVAPFGKAEIEFFNAIAAAVEKASKKL